MDPIQQPRRVTVLGLEYFKPGLSSGSWQQILAICLTGRHRIGDWVIKIWKNLLSLKWLSMLYFIYGLKKKVRFNIHTIYCYLFVIHLGSTFPILSFFIFFIYFFLKLMYPFSFKLETRYMKLWSIIYGKSFSRFGFY